MFINWMIFSGFPFIVLNGNDWHMMGEWSHMMDWWGVPFMGFWWIGVWIVQFVIALLVYRDAYKRKDNGLLWFILVIFPWMGIVFLVIYIIIRGETCEMESYLKNGQKIFDERYAKGEITREEYLQGKKDIKDKIEKEKKS